MSREKSEEMMRLLQEIAVIKQMDSENSDLPNDPESSHAQSERARRRAEISEEMQQLANETKAESD